MTRFVNPAATRTVDLGPCECPGTPHENDWAKVRAELSGSEIARIQQAPQTEDGLTEAIIPFIPEWNLLSPSGDEWPVTADAISLLNAATLTAITNVLTEVLAESSRLPNPSSAPSPASSRGSASKTLKALPKTGT